MAADGNKIDKPVTGMDENEAIAAFSRSSIAMVLTNPRLEDNPIIYVNRAFEKLTGYAAAAAIGRNCRFLQGEETEESQVDRIREAIDRHEDIALTLRNVRADGSTFRNAVVISPIRDDDGEVIYFLGIQREIGDEDSDIQEVERLLTEIQHRVKNHLAMIVSMIRMQARSDSADGDFEAVSRRVETLQLLYEEMNAAQRSNTDTIDLGAYLARVGNAVAHLDGRPGVRVNIDTEPLEADTSKAVNVGLIVSELLTNALVHGFEGRDQGLVELRTTRTSQNGIRIIVADDGVGMREDAEKGLGSSILNGLVSAVDARLEYMQSEVGTTAVLDIPKRATEPLDDI